MSGGHSRVSIATRMGEHYGRIMALDRRVLGIVLAGGEGKRLMPLTRDRAKPAVPFGGFYRLVDFVLSNLVNGGYFRICVLTQYKSHSLDRHITHDLADVDTARRLRHASARTAAAGTALVHGQCRCHLSEPQPGVRREARLHRGVRRGSRVPDGSARRWSNSTSTPGQESRSRAFVSRARRPRLSASSRSQTTAAGSPRSWRSRRIRPGCRTRPTKCSRRWATTCSRPLR